MTSSEAKAQPTNFKSPSELKSQWDCIRRNIGTWHGSFMQFSADGELQKNTPSVLSLEETEPDKTMVLVLDRSPENEPKKVNRLTFTYPGPAPYTYFFESGAFSQGAAQWSSFGQFVTEFSLKVGDRRVRFVVAYESTARYTSALKYVTLICETQAGGTQFVSESPMSEQMPEQMLGTWQGDGETLASASGEFEQVCHSQWQLNKLADNRLSLACIEQLDRSTYRLGLVSDESAFGRAVIRLENDEDKIAYQLMLLPKGAYCLLPREICRESEFRIEVGWVSEKGVRSRFIRYYDKRGVWIHSALLTDTQLADT